MNKEEEWTEIIESKGSWLDFHLDQIWKYRDLLLLLVKRDFYAGYKQTLFGPFWFVIQPLFSAFVYTVVFGRIAKIPTDGVPPTLFFMTGVTAWNYFSDCITRTSSTFVANAGIFGKVYFPRMVVPLSNVVSSLIKFGIQFVTLLVFIGFYYLNGSNVRPNAYVMLTPLLLVIMAGMGLGFGIIISSLTIKYRDLRNFMGFGVQLLMYATPIVYPLSMVPDKFRIISNLNPMTSVIETFKYAFLGGGELNLLMLGYSFCVMLLLLFIGLMLFSRVEKSFMDTV